MRYLIISLLFLMACTPTGAHDGAAVQRAVYFTTPQPSRTPINVDAAQADLSYKMQALQATSAGIYAQITAQSMQMTKEAADRQWEIIQSTMRAGDNNATATARAVGTSTAQAQPYVYASNTALANGVSIDNKRAAVRQELEFWRQVIPLAALGVFAWGVWSLCKAVAKYIISRINPPEPVYDEPEPAAPAPQPNPQLTVYVGEPSNIKRMQKSELPCSAEEMDTLAFWAVVRGDKSLAINLWEGRGLSGRIKEVRSWAKRNEYANEDEKHYIEWNELGLQVLEAWRAERPAITRAGAGA